MESPAIPGRFKKAQIAQFEAAWKRYREIHQEVMRLALLNSNVEAKIISRKEVGVAVRKAEKSLGELADVDHQLEAAQAAAGTDLGARALVVLQIERDMLAVQRAEKNMVLETDEAEMKKLSQDIEKLKASINARLTALEKVLPARDMSKFNEFKTAWGELVAADAKVQAKALENGNELATQLSAGKGHEALSEAQAIIDAITNAADKSMDTDKADSAAAYSSSRNLMIGVALAGILLCLLVGVMVARSVSQSLRMLFKGLKSFSTAELGETSNIFKEVVTGLNAGAEQVSTASTQVSGAAQSLASGAAQQAASVEETSSSLEEIASMIRQNADNAAQADSLSHKAATSMSQLNDSMKEMSRAGQETAKIVKTIDAIAFQTNLLALNAAVEAARAGEAGAGFAVVAEEVRNLAQRAADAAKNTTNLIDDIVGRIKEGTATVEEANEDFNRVTGLVSEIAAASREQSQGVEQVNVAMGEIDKVVQQSAANAEESAAASEEMNAQSEEVRGLVNRMLVLLEGSDGYGAMTQPRFANEGRTRQEPVIVALPAPNGNGGNAKHAPAASIKNLRKAKPEDAIPMDDDFREF